MTAGVLTRRPGINLAAASARSPRMLLRMLRAAQPISRVELARRLDVNRSTVTEIVKPLIAAGIVLEEPVEISSAAGRIPGRPALDLRFNLARRDLFAGINIGVRQTQVGLADLGNTILAETEFATPAEPENALAQTRSVLSELLAGLPADRLRFIGVSVPGPADAERRRLLYAPHLDWTDVPVAEALRIKGDEGNSAIPVIVDNDSTAAAMYEARLRSATETGSTDFILVRSGTGIGVGVVLGGEVYRGTGTGRGVAGEFGHMTIVAGGKPCACGNRGCWERYASASSAAALYAGERLNLASGPALRFVEIVARAEAGELRAQRTLERIGEYLGIGIRNVIMGLGVPRVIISGRVVYGWRFVREPLQRAIEQSMAGIVPNWSVEAGEPRGAGMGGALELAVDEFLTSTLVSYLSSGSRAAVA